MRTTAFTRRDREIIELRTGGLTNHELGRRIFIGESMVKCNVRGVTRRLVPFATEPSEAPG